MDSVVVLRTKNNERSGRKEERENGKSKRRADLVLSERSIVLGDGLGALRDGVLGELTGKEEADGGLDLPRGDGLPVVVAGEADGLGGELLEDIGNERVHDGHGLKESEALRERNGARRRNFWHEAASRLRLLGAQTSNENVYLVGDTSVGVDLLEDLVDEGRVRGVITLGGAIGGALGLRGGSGTAGSRHADYQTQ